MSFPKVLPVFCVAFFVCFGCASDRYPVNPNVMVADRDTVSSQPVELPGNYNIENYRKLTLATLPGPIVSDAFDDANLRYMSLRLQSELFKVKRFSVAALHGTDSTVLQTLEDLGEVEMAQQERPTKIDLLASWNTTIHPESYNYGRTTEITFVCSINLTCKDLRTGQIRLSKDLDIRVKRTQIRDSTGMMISGGFEYNSDAAVQGLMQDIATQAAIRIANEIGNEYPIGGRVTGVLGTELMAMDKGAEQGIEKGTQMVVYTSVGGIDLPLANAYASPSSNTAQLSVYRWNDDNKYVRKIQKQIEADPNWLKNHELYAVSCGMAVPPRWQRKRMYLPTSRD